MNNEVWRDREYIHLQDRCAALARKLRRVRQAAKEYMAGKLVDYKLGLTQRIADAESETHAAIATMEEAVRDVVRLNDLNRQLELRLANALDSIDMSENLNRQLADRVAACSELLAARAERFEREAYCEGFRAGECSEERWLLNKDEIDQRWQQSDSAKRLAERDNDNRDEPPQEALNG